MYAYDYDQTGFRNIKDFFEGTVIKFEDLENSDGVGEYNVTGNNVWKATIPKACSRNSTKSENRARSGKNLFEPVEAATDQEITEKASHAGISSEKMSGQAWSQDARKLVRINGIGSASTTPAMKHTPTITNWWSRAKAKRFLHSAS